MWRRHQVDRLLEKVDAVVYLLDYTKLKTREEADVLRRRVSIPFWGKIESMIRGMV